MDSGKESKIRMQIQFKGVMVSNQIPDDEIVYKNKPVKQESFNHVEASLSILDLTDLFQKFIKNSTPLREITEMSVSLISWENPSVTMLFGIGFTAFVLYFSIGVIMFFPLFIFVHKSLFRYLLRFRQNQLSLSERIQIYKLNTL